MDRRIFYMLNKAHHRLLKHSDRELSDRFGITAVQLSALFFLSENDGCLLKDLSTGLELNNSAITGLVGRMEKGEFIEKRPCAADGRAFRVHMTDKGKSVAVNGLSYAKKFNDFLSENFSPEELEVIIRFLNVIAIAFGYKKSIS